MADDPQIDAMLAFVEQEEAILAARASKRREQFNGTGMVGKAIVHGLLDRGGEDSPSQVRLAVVPSSKRKVLHWQIKQNVKKGVIVYTDALPSYEGLSSEYIHKTVDHAISYAVGEVHTNGMENFWSLLKRALGGTYVAVAPKHLVRYCAEEAFRFNQRGGSDATRFHQAMQNTPGKRLTYKALTVGV